MRLQAIVCPEGATYDGKLLNAKKAKFLDVFSVGLLGDPNDAKLERILGLRRSVAGAPKTCRVILWAAKLKNTKLPAAPAETTS